MIPRLVLARRIRVANVCGFIFHLIHSLTAETQAGPRSSLYYKLIDEPDQDHILPRQDFRPGNDSVVFDFPK